MSAHPYRRGRCKGMNLFTNRKRLFGNSCLSHRGDKQRTKLLSDGRQYALILHIIYYKRQANFIEPITENLHALSYILYSTSRNIRSTGWNVRSMGWNIHSTPWNVEWN